MTVQPGRRLLTSTLASCRQSACSEFSATVSPNRNSAIGLSVAVGVSVFVSVGRGRGVADGLTVGVSCGVGVDAINGIGALESVLQARLAVKRTRKDTKNRRFMVSPV